MFLWLQPHGILNFKVDRTSDNKWKWDRWPPKRLKVNSKMKAQCQTMHDLEHFILKKKKNTHLGKKKKVFWTAGRTLSSLLLRGELYWLLTFALEVTEKHLIVVKKNVLNGTNISFGCHHFGSTSALFIYFFMILNNYSKKAFSILLIDFSTFVFISFISNKAF